VITYPHPNVKLVNGKTPAEATYLHRDHLGSVRAITTPAAVQWRARPNGVDALERVTQMLR
jgi:hypothetical protein